MSDDRGSPSFCRPEAYKRLRAELATLDDSTFSLVRAASAISAHRLPNENAGDVVMRIARIAFNVKSRVTTGTTTSLLAHLHGVLFDELGFRGDEVDYYDPLNSYLSSVLERRRGLPITLTLVYKAVGRNLGLSIEGIGAPGHFLAEVADGRSRMLVDPFDGGRVMSREDAFRRMEDATGATIARDDRHLPRTSNRMWLARILANLKNAFGRRGSWDDVRAMDELAGLLGRIS